MSSRKNSIVTGCKKYFWISIELKKHEKSCSNCPFEWNPEQCQRFRREEGFTRVRAAIA